MQFYEKVLFDNISFSSILTTCLTPLPIFNISLFVYLCVYLFNFGVPLSFLSSDYFIFLSSLDHLLFLSASVSLSLPLIFYKTCFCLFLPVKHRFWNKVFKISSKVLTNTPHPSPLQSIWKFLPSLFYLGNSSTPHRHSQWGASSCQLDNATDLE